MLVRKGIKLKSCSISSLLVPFFCSFSFATFKFQALLLVGNVFFLFKATSEHSPSVPVPHKKGDSAIGWEPGRKYQGRLAEKLWLLHWWCEHNTQTDRTAKHQNKYALFCGKCEGVKGYLACRQELNLFIKCNASILIWRWPGEDDNSCIAVWARIRLTRKLLLKLFSLWEYRKAPPPSQSSPSK